MATSHMRVQWRAALAVYVGSFAMAVALSLGVTPLRIPPLAVTVLSYLLSFALFAGVGLGLGWSRSEAAGSALLCVGATSVLSYAVLRWTAATGPEVFDGYTSAFLANARGSLGIGFGALIVLLIGWGWRDGRWPALLWLSGVEMIGTVVAVIAAARGSLNSQFSVSIVLLDSTIALRSTVAWLLVAGCAMLIARRKSVARDVPVDE